METPRTPRKIRQLSFVAFGQTPLAIALADDGSVWQAYLVVDRDGVTFRYPSLLGGTTIGEMPPGWTECGACLLPDRPLRDVAINPPFVAKMPNAPQPERGQ